MNLRAAREFEIMVHAVVPVHFVSRLKTDADVAGIELYAATGIEDAVGIAVPDGSDLVGEGPGGNPARQRQSSAVRP